MYINKFFLSSIKVIIIATIGTLCCVGFKTTGDTVFLFGQRLKSIREASGLTQEQVRDCTGISRSHVASIEAGTINTGINNVPLFARLFGLADYELFQYESDIPDPEFLRKNISKYLKDRNIDPNVFFKESAVYYIEKKLLSSKFFSSPRYTKEISEYFNEKFDIKFDTTRLSHALESFVRKGLVEKLETDKKTKFQYRKKD